MLTNHKIIYCFNACHFIILSPFFFFSFFSETIKKTLRSQGNVLLPVDTAGRVLELLQILESVSREKIMTVLVLVDSTVI